MGTTIMTGTWVLVADSEKALFLRNVGDAFDFHFEVVRKETQDNPATREQGAHKPGRFNDGPSVQRSAVADTDWHELEKERFATDVADLLYRRAIAGDFEEIVIVAAPSLLGNLRTELHSEVRDKVVAEVDKNLTNEPIDKLEARLADLLGTARDRSTVEFG
ncbi:host attachment protein [Aliiruegeria haliotis]